MNVPDDEFQFCARLEWVDGTMVQVFPDGAIYFEETPDWPDGRVEPEELQNFLKEVAHFGETYAKALAKLKEL